MSSILLRKLKNIGSKYWRYGDNWKRYLFEYVLRFVEDIMKILDNIILKIWKYMGLERYILYWKIWRKIWKDFFILDMMESSIYYSSHSFWRLSCMTMCAEYRHMWLRVTGELLLSNISELICWFLLLVTSFI